MKEIEQSVHALMVNENNELLLQLRDNKKEIYFPGYWGVLGGRVEEGETALQALKREIKEEINYKIVKPEYLGHIKFTGFKCSFFKHKIKDKLKDIPLYEGVRLQFFKLEELKNLHLIPIMKKFILKHKEEIYGINTS